MRAYGYDRIGRVPSIGNTPANAADNVAYGIQSNRASQITPSTRSNTLFAIARDYPP